RRPVAQDPERGQGVHAQVVFAVPVAEASVRELSAHADPAPDLAADERLAALGADRVGRSVEEAPEVAEEADGHDHHARVRTQGPTCSLREEMPTARISASPWSARACRTASAPTSSTSPAMSVSKMMRTGASAAVEIRGMKASSPAMSTVISSPFRSLIPTSL